MFCQYAAVSNLSMVKKGRCNGEQSSRAWGATRIWEDKAMAVGIYRVIGILLLTACPVTGGEWCGPLEMLRGNWGKGQEEFGLEYGEIKDKLPWTFAVLQDERIVIDDWLNARWKLYTSGGKLIKSMKQPGLGMLPLKGSYIATVICMKEKGGVQPGVYDIDRGEWKWKDKPIIPRGSTRLRPGDRVAIEGGVVTSYKGEWRLNVSKGGSISKL